MEAPAATGARIQQEAGTFPVDLGLVGVPEDDEAEVPRPGRGHVGPAVHDAEAQPVGFVDDSQRQLGERAIGVDVAAHGSHGCDGGELGEHLGMADVPGMENAVDAEENIERARPDEAVRIGDHANAHGRNCSLSSRNRVLRSGTMSFPSVTVRGVAISAAVGVVTLAGSPGFVRAASAAESQEAQPGLREIVRQDPLAADTWRHVGERMAEKLVDHLPNVVLAAILLLAFIVLNRLLQRLLREVFQRAQADVALQSMGLRLTKLATLTLGFLLAAAQLGFQVGSLLAGVGVVGLAVGFAAQDTLANIIAGIAILWDRPFIIGDYVRIGDAAGTVTEIGLRSTRLRTIEQYELIVPNKDIAASKVLNQTRAPQVRIAIRVGIGYGEDPRRAREVLVGVMSSQALVATEPRPPEVAVVLLGDSSVELEVRVWLLDPHTERQARSELTELVKSTLDQAGIEIPFPQRTVHLRDGR